jgi:hypothetical protein
MKAERLVRSRDDLAAVLPPVGDDAVDRARVELGTVREHDDRRLDLGRELGEPAAERRAGTALPFPTANGARVGVDVVRSEDDDDVVDGARLAHTPQHLGQQQPLLRRAESRGRSRGEHDRYDGQRQPSSARQRVSTFATYVIVSDVGARPPASSTAVGPALYAASATSVEW